MPGIDDECDLFFIQAHRVSHLLSRIGARWCFTRQSAFEQDVNGGAGSLNFAEAYRYQLEYLS